MVVDLPWLGRIQELSQDMEVFRAYLHQLCHDVVKLHVVENASVFWVMRSKLLPKVDFVSSSFAPDAIELLAEILVDLLLAIGQ